MPRPAGSQIRQNVVEILFHMRKGYGYEIYKVYRELFPSATMRSIYYNLRKGLETGETRIDKVEKTAGDYSWGTESEKTIYALGENAQAKGLKKVKDYFEKKRS